MELGELITELEKLDPDMTVAHGFNRPHSYRGFYEQLAFVPIENVTVRSMLSSASDALDRIFQGWKGGEYEMHEHTDVWLSEPGSTGVPIYPQFISMMAETNVSDIEKELREKLETLKVYNQSREDRIEILKRDNFQMAREIRTIRKQSDNTTIFGNKPFLAVPYGDEIYVINIDYIQCFKPSKDGQKTLVFMRDHEEFVITADVIFKDFYEAVMTNCTSCGIDEKQLINGLDDEPDE